METYWLSDCKKYGIVQSGDRYFEMYQREYHHSPLRNIDAQWSTSYQTARRFITEQLCVDNVRMRKVSEEEFNKEKGEITI